MDPANETVDDQTPLVRALIGLTVVTGLVDAISFLGLGHIFTANMTGNLVFLGFAAGGAPGIRGSFDRGIVRVRRWECVWWETHQQSPADSGCSYADRDVCGNGSAPDRCQCGDIRSERCVGLTRLRGAPLVAVELADDQPRSSLLGYVCELSLIEH